MRNLPYFIVDVFAEQKYAGNQLAVFTDAGNLDEKEMQQIALEINYAETTFILSKEKVNGGYDVRIFTPAEEVPFAGHPTIGTAFVINHVFENNSAKKIMLNLKGGQIPVEPIEGYYWMRQNNPKFGNNYDIIYTKDLLDLNSDDFDENYPITDVSTGLPFMIVPLKNLDAVKRASVDLKRFQSHFTNNENAARAVLVFSPETYHSSNDINCRMFAEEYGVVEDAATGSANGCLLSWFLKNNYFNKNEISVSVEQGYEMNRPSLLLHKGKKIDEENFEINIGGKIQMVAEGKWY